MTLSADNNFVGRDKELEIFDEILQHPRGDCRVLAIHGAGGIGKTRLVRRMLGMARDRHPNALVVDEPIDIQATQHRHIDGLQRAIRDGLSNAASLGNALLSTIGPDPVTSNFRLYDARPTAETYHQCLANLCRDQVAVVAFDTFEHLHDDAAGRWVLGASEPDLQVPGLLCIVASRREHSSTSLIRALPLGGFSYSEAARLYQNVTRQVSDAATRTLESNPATLQQMEEVVQGLVDKTRGHPLLLELAFKWLGGGLWKQEALSQLSIAEFEEKLMQRAREFGEFGDLDVGRLPVSQAVYSAIVCMSYLDRRFDRRLLSRLVDEGFVRLDPSQNREDQIRDILGALERYFFVKVRQSAQSGGIGEIQLHDEMVQLVWHHLWPGWSDEDTRQRLARRVVDWYDEMIH